MDAQLTLTETELTQYADDSIFGRMPQSINTLRSFMVECADNGRILTYSDVKIGYALSGRGTVGLNLYSLIRYILCHYDNLGENVLYVSLRQSRQIPFTTGRVEYTVIVKVTENKPEAHLKQYAPKVYKRNRKGLN